MDEENICKLPIDLKETPSTLKLFWTTKEVCVSRRNKGRNTTRLHYTHSLCLSTVYWVCAVDKTVTHSELVIRTLLWYLSVQIVSCISRTSPGRLQDVYSKRHEGPLSPRRSLLVIQGLPVTINCRRVNVHASTWVTAPHSFRRSQDGDMSVSLQPEWVVVSSVLQQDA